MKAWFIPRVRQLSHFSPHSRQGCLGSSGGRQSRVRIREEIPRGVHLGVYDGAQENLWLGARDADSDTANQVGAGRVRSRDMRPHGARLITERFRGACEERG